MLKGLGTNLKAYLEQTEGKELVRNVKNNKISIYPKGYTGDPVNDMLARPTIEIRFDMGNNKIVLSWIYLVNINSGIGTSIIELIIQFCKANNIERFNINSIHQDNLLMFKLGNKFGFNKVNTIESDYYNLSLDIV